MAGRLPSRWAPSLQARPPRGCTASSSLSCVRPVRRASRGCLSASMQRARSLPRGQQPSPPSSPPRGRRLCPLPSRQPCPHCRRPQCRRKCPPCFPRQHQRWSPPPLRLWNPHLRRPRCQLLSRPRRLPPFRHPIQLKSQRRCQHQRPPWSPRRFPPRPRRLFRHLFQRLTLLLWCRPTQHLRSSTQP